MTGKGWLYWSILGMCYTVIGLCALAGASAALRRIRPATDPNPRLYEAHRLQSFPAGISDEVDELDAIWRLPDYDPEAQW